MKRIHLKDDGQDYYPLMMGGYLAVIKRCIQWKEYIQLVCKSVSGYYFVVKNENEAGMSKCMENFIKTKRHEIERIKYYQEHYEEIRQCKHGYCMSIVHRTGRNPKTDEYFCHCLLCNCEGEHSKDIDEAVRLWNESRTIGGEGDRV